MRIIFTLAFLFTATLAMAQQRAQYSQFALNNYLQNPAITGIEDYTDVKMGFRNQWVGVEGAPRSYYLSAHMPLNKVNTNTTVDVRLRNGKKVKTVTSRNRNNKAQRIKPHHGLGFIAESDKSAAITRTSFNLTYAYHLPVSRTIRVAGGLSTGVLNYGINPQGLYMDNAADPALANGMLKNTQLDLGLGLWAYSAKFFGGISTSQFVAKKRNFINRDDINQQGPLQAHYYISGGVRLDVSPSLALVPSFLTKLASPSPASTDLNLKAMYNDRVYIGGSYRTNDAFTALAGCNISPFISIGYAYDATTSELNQFSQGSHEVVLNLKLMNRSKAICPSWLW